MEKHKEYGFLGIDMHLRNDIGVIMNPKKVYRLIKKYGMSSFVRTKTHINLSLYVVDRLIAKLGILHSMSRRGNCIDNAIMETFFGHFKDECLYKEANN
ncbi:MAG: family transposase [Haloplasmataceae bacterium]|jgi:transposase InsO family protein|nr:family transposase [Haloplasmataceae bacterium]